MRVRTCVNSHVSRLLFCLGLAWFSQDVLGEVITAEMLEFRYQEFNEPWSSYTCQHKIQIEPYDWVVRCSVNDKVKVFWAHLAISYFGKTRYGKSAYEILYWVSNQEPSAGHKYSSITTWLHNTQENARASLLEISQGIEDDRAGLNLTVSLTKP